MSDINEKMIGEFLELLKKIGSLEMQVQSMAGEYSGLIKKATDMTQNMQDTMDNKLKNQNDVVTNSINRLANQINDAISTLNSKMSAVNSQLNNNSQEEKFKELSEKLENVCTFLSSFGKNYQLYKQSISKLDFTSRTVNCLRAENIETVEDLLKWTERELLKTPNLGRKSLTEIKCVLRNLGLKLND
jgi:DNA-directed RNA polymerase alpha subunit